MSEFIFRLTDWTAEGEGWSENITKSIHNYQMIKHSQ